MVILNSDQIDKKKLILVKRTEGISSSVIRKKSYLNYKKILKKI